MTLKVKDGTEINGNRLVDENRNITANTITASGNINSTTSTSGTIIVTGGVGISQNLYVGQTINAQNITSSTYTSTVASGTAPLSVTSTTVVTNLNSDTVDGFHASTTNVSGRIVVRDSSNNISITTATFTGSSGVTTLQSSSTGAGVTISLPATSGSLVGTGDTGTVTNTMLAGSIANAKLVNSTISGVSLGSNLNTLTIGTGLSGTSYNGSSAVTIAIDSTVALRADTHYIGTTAVTLNRATGSLALTGISSVTLPGSSSGSVQVIPTASAGTGTVLTLPATTGTVITSGDTGTVTNTMLAGSIANAKLVNSTISGVSLGSNLNTLTIGTGLSGVGYNGSGPVIITIDSTVATLTGIQTLTNKTLTSPTISTSVLAGSSSIDLFNTTAATLNIGGAATTVSIGASSGTTTVNNNLTVTGNLVVNGTTTTVNSTTITVDDITLELGSVAVPSDVTAAGGGIILKGSTDKSITWGSTNGWTSTESINIATGKTFKINGIDVVSSTGLGSGVTASSLTSVGTITSGTWSGSFGAVSGANLTSLTAGNLSGTIPSAVLGNSTVYVGTTAVALNRATNNLALTGISSVTFPGSTSGSSLLQAQAIAGTTTFTLPTTNGTLVGTGDTGTVTSTMIADGTIVNGDISASAAIALSKLSTTGTANNTTYLRGDGAWTTIAVGNALTIGTGLSGTSYNGSSAVTIAIDGTVATLSGTQTLTNKTLTFPVVDNIKLGFTSTPTAGSTTTLTATSNRQQRFTGSLAQTVVLPVTSTLVAGVSYEIKNASTGNITVNSSGSNSVATVNPGDTMKFTCIGTTLTTAADWDATYDTFSSSPVTLSGTQTLTNKTLTLPVIDSIKYSITTTAMGSGVTVTLTSASNCRQRFTGFTLYSSTVILPVTSTLVVGMTYEITNANTSSGNITVNSSGGDSVSGISPQTTMKFTCIGTTLTTAADWEYTVIGVKTNTISGVQLGNNLASLTVNTPLTITSTYTGRTAATISLASGYGDTQNPYASKSAKLFLASPSGAAGVPSFRAIATADLGTGTANNTTYLRGDGVWTTISAASSSGLSSAIFTASGTWTIPAGVSKCKVTVVGPGGNGGSGGGAGIGGGGGAGGTAIKWLTGLVAGNTLTVTVSTLTGLSSISSGTQTINAVTALQGTASGTINTTTTSFISDFGATGGSASGGDINITGEKGGVAQCFGTLAMSMSGRGGSTQLGTGGAPVIGASANGNNGVGYGAGGSGGIQGGGGGNGAPGIVIFEY